MEAWKPAALGLGVKRRMYSVLPKPNVPGRSTLETQPGGCVCAWCWRHHMQGEMLGRSCIISSEESSPRRRRCDYHYRDVFQDVRGRDILVLLRRTWSHAWCCSSVFATLSLPAETAQACRYHEEYRKTRMRTSALI